ncbi:MAG: undecaprenyl-diphosphate phosphatase [Holosporales bacterium]|jgi:undecaprenyl-diphosphatase|nr:undecaprenyl-diphosphate phosphatase [Holosporales bacterium]
MDECYMQEGMRLFLLGALQGITEFLPVSSSAHLALLPQFLNWQDQGQGVDVFLNVGTLGVLFLYLFKEMRAFIKGGLDVVRRRTTSNRFFFLKVLIAALPVIVVGGIVEIFFESRLNNPVLLAGTTALFSIILLGGDRTPQRAASLHYQGSFTEAFLIGCAQIFSLIPGASRLGVCLSAMRFLGYDRIEAFRFSMLLSIPPVMGALTLKSVKVVMHATVLPWGAIMGGCIAAFVCGMLTFKGASYWISKGGTLTPFVVYRFFLAVLMFIL